MFLTNLICIFISVRLLQYFHSIINAVYLAGHVAGKAVPVLWSRNGLITCPETQSSMVVVEEGFYQHSTNACDDHCRPQMTGGQNVTCSFRNGTCVQGLSSRDLAAIYDLCWPSALPCNLTNANLSSSLVVRYSCMTGELHMQVRCAGRTLKS